MTTLDTSGHIDIRPRPGYTATVRWRWEDLSPFAQGYVEALIQSVDAERRAARPFGQYLRLGFSDLAPEALAMILRDCEEHLKTYGLAAGDPRLPARGRWFWKNRQTGMWAKSEAGLVGGFPPLRVYLNDDGKVMLEIAR